MFLETSQELVSPLAAAVTAGERAHVEHGAHALLGAAGSIGALRLVVRARALEKAARDPDGGNLAGLLQEMMVELQELVVELAERVSGIGRESRS